ncbi:BA14K family protein [Rhizobium sullae]|uniref:Lectin-like protein BA14k n=1 Tax=Rhizobium sullae TaxID=50338 RepID=A0A2N0D1X0_RHISU|nr:BA14K family protein [Rhizobium sullae]PKA40121.1 BA14K family protein [Rhizobium sullae]TCU19075.1 BA14K-like protein [Rhizobium sullae]UWU14917.1 BA14K family protein [Rhizobium sullae]
MNGLSKKIASAVFSAVVVLTSFVPSQAIQMPAAPQIEKSDVQNVQYRRYYPPGYRPIYRPGYRPGYYPGYRPAYRPAYRPGWYGGYRGYPYYRRGYREYNGYWYPLAAFGAGAIIGGAIASQPRYVAPPAYSGGGGHVAWCANRYRSYRAYDNTFQPYNGPRQQCYSPYN